MLRTSFASAAAGFALLAACGTTTEDAGEAAADAPEALPPYEAPATLAEATAGPSEVAMWRVGDDDTTIYMIGTVHLLREGTEWRTDEYEAAFAEADAVYLEADALSPEVQAQVQALIPELGMNPPGTTLTSYFMPEEVAEVDALIAPLGVQLAQLDPFRPWFAGLTLGVLGIQSVSGTPEAGVETIISAQAAEAGKPLRYLETAEEQLRMLASDDDEVQAALLVASAEDFANLEGYFAELVGAWYDGRPDVVAGMMNEAFEEFPSAAETLLYRRNENWAGQLSELIESEEGTFLVAVGAGHLAGERSVQDYLEAEGFAAERL
jgi:uncharacterized protein YbaP (TraB family)